MNQKFRTRVPESYISPAFMQIDFRSECDSTAGSINGNVPSKWETGNEEWW